MATLSGSCAGGQKAARMAFTETEDGDWVVLDVGPAMHRSGCAVGQASRRVARCGAPPTQARDGASPQAAAGLKQHRVCKARDGASKQAAVESIKSRVNSDFMHIQPTWTVTGRLFADAHPYAATAGLWTLVCVVVLGELATTLWWLMQLDTLSMTLLALVASFALAALSAVMTIPQVAVLSLSAAIAVGHGLPSYTLITVLRPPPGTLPLLGTSQTQEESCGCMLDINLAHWFALTAVAVLHFADASPSDFLKPLSEHTLRRFATVALTIACIIYGCIAALEVTNYPTMGGVHVQCRQSSSLLGELIANIAGHSASLVRRRMLDYFGLGLLPRLLGVHSPHRLSPQEFAMRYGQQLVSMLPMIEEHVPPPAGVAGVGILHWFALPGLPALAILLHTDLMLTLTVVVGAPVLMVLAAIRLQDEVPTAPLRRVPLLLPGLQLSPASRTALGYALETAARLQTWREGFNHAIFGPPSE
mmetsp:Transcript_51335/g.94861  ORF Transcript_51335/g.94861 Transcript_51335/m.94861 type:complete len:476 (-) Transcript_51335:104-1531(-)